MTLESSMRLPILATLLVSGASALFVDAARILGLAQGVTATATRERLLQTGAALGLKPQEYESWVGAFEFVQSLRLRLQLEPDVARSAHPNRLTLQTLSDIDRRILATSLREARRLQQRLELDYAR
jgi:CBS domain-containing protein